MSNFKPPLPKGPKPKKVTEVVIQQPRRRSTFRRAKKRSGYRNMQNANAIMIPPPQISNISQNPVKEVVERYLPGFGNLAQSIGQGAQKFLAHVFGSGDYVIKENTVSQGTIPSFVTNNNNSVRKAGTEKIIDIVVTTDAWKLLINNEPINPTNSFLFPVLSQMFNKRYTKYKLHGLVFYAKTFGANSVVSTNPTVGGILAATKYNVLSGPFKNENEMENHYFKSIAKSSETLIHPIECKASKTTDNGLLFMDNTPNGNSNDPRFTQLGLFSLACMGNPVAGLTHKLFVDYDIEFFEEDPQVSNVPHMHLQLVAADMTGGTGIFSTNTVVKYCDSAKQNLVTGNGLVLTLDSSLYGNFEVDINIYGTSTASANAPAVSSKSSNVATGTNLYSNGSVAVSGEVSVARTVATVSSKYSFTKTADGNAGTITFAAYTPPGGTLTGDVFIRRLDNAFI